MGITRRMIRKNKLTVIKVFLPLILSCFLCVHVSHGIYTDQQESLHTEEYCQVETFHPKCTKNEAILMNSAIYGRMRVGRCLTADEVAEFGDDPRYFRCSMDVLSILDKKCSGMNECEIRHIDITKELTSKPCASGLNVYLEVSYDCVPIADEGRSCSLTATNDPSYIIASSGSQRKCGAHNQPWSIDAPTGQKIKVSLIDFLASQSDRSEDKKKISCLGVIVDRTAKRNISICIGGEQRTKYLYSSAADALEIFYNSQEERRNSSSVREFGLKFEAIGCSDLIPPEDAWLKRSDDSIVIGCYSNRQTWQLHCEGEIWIGVFGNCSQSQEKNGPSEAEPDIRETNWSNGQVLTVVAVCGLTLTICLAVLCTGIVCLRKFSVKKSKDQEYRVLDFQLNSSINNCGNDSSMMSSTGVVNGVQSDCATHQKMAPTYSVFVGDGDFK